MKKITERWKGANWLCRISYLLIGLLFFWIPFEGLVLESFDLHFLGAQGVYALYIATIISTVIARRWKLTLLTIVGALLIYAAVIGIAEVLWYYLKTWFDIDISYR